MVPMSYLGSPNRGNDPLHVWTMVLALVLAAALGAGVGFAIDALTGAADAPASAGSEP